MARPAARITTPRRRESNQTAAVIPFRPRRKRRSTYYRYRRGKRGFWSGLAVLAGLIALAWWVLGASHPQRPRVTPGDRPASRPLIVPRALVAPPRPRATPVANTGGELPIIGGPSLDARRVDGILAAYGSPLHGQGKQIVGLSTRYQLDDAVALAFFVMESRAGTQGEAALTRSFGNLRPMPGEPAMDGYRSYATWLDGATEWFQVLHKLYVGQLNLTTVEAIVPVYAPSTDYNDPASMIFGIRQLVHCWRGDLSACPDDPAGVRAVVASGRTR